MFCLAGIRGRRRELAAASCGMSAGWRVPSIANRRDQCGMPIVVFPIDRPFRALWDKDAPATKGS
jgi:hypothetical protein